MAMKVEVGRIERTDREYPRFVRELHRYDEKLAPCWHKVKRRWLIRRKTPTGNWINVLWLQGPEGQYREPGEWVLFKLQSMDMFRKVPLTQDTEKWAADVDRLMHEDKIEKAKKKDAQEREEALEQHWKPYLRHRTGERVVECMNPEVRGNKTGQRPTLGSADWKPKSERK